MPYADPEKSFEAAVHHLFRHLTDASALRRNPLVRARFAKAKTKAAADAALRDVRDRVLLEAAACYSDDAAGGLYVQACRQHAIVVGICAGESASETAGLLKISRRQYYRDRQAVCARVAERLKPAAPERTPVVQISEPQQLLLSRAASFCDQGLGHRAVAILDQAWSGIPPGSGRLTARLELADALISFGDLTRARRLLEYARNEITKSGDKTGVGLGDRATLIEARLALARGDDARAGLGLVELANRQIAVNRIDETALDTLIECGLWHCSNARFPSARKMLRRARVVAGKLTNLAPYRQVALALLHAYCAEDIVDDYNGSHQRFNAALELSIANASSRGTLESTIGLMGYYGSVGREEEMFALAERALDIARMTEGRRHLLFAAAWIGTTLLKTRYWRAVDPLVFEAERISVPGTLHWVFIKEAQADYLARTAEYDGAQTSFAAVQEAATNLANRKWQAIVFRDMGLMLKRLGSSESITSMQRAVELAEGSAGAWTLSLTYRAASEVLPDSRLASRGRRSDIATSPSPRRTSTVGTISNGGRERRDGLTLFGGQSSRTSGSGFSS